MQESATLCGLGAMPFALHVEAVLSVWVYVFVSGWGQVGDVLVTGLMESGTNRGVRPPTPCLRQPSLAA